MKVLLLVASLFLTLNASAATEAEFKQCVQIKDITFAIAQQADKGASRTDLKSRVDPSAYEMIDWVYDFRGAFSNRQMAQKQMDTCLKHFGFGKKRQN